MIRLIELFAGVGSQAKALKRLGVDFEHHKICENDKFAMRSYNALYGTDFAISDITKLCGKDLEITQTDEFLYILTYSFPCQALSVAGLQKGFEEGSGTTSSLVWEVLRVLKETENLPQILLMENVTMVHSAKNFPVFQKLIKELEKLGYTSFYADLNAKNYGVPQNRNRCFMVSFQKGYGENFSFPKPFVLQKKLSDLLEKDVPEKYFLSEQAVAKMKMKNTEIAKTVRIGGRCSYDNKHTWDLVLVGYVNSDGYENAFQMAKRVYHESGISPTLTTMSGSKRVPLVLVDGGIKRIRQYTELEIFRLMDFDDDDYFTLKELGMSVSQMRKQMGNSICVGVLTEIFREILKSSNFKIQEKNNL